MSNKVYSLINYLEKVIELWLFVLKACINPIEEWTIHVKQSLQSNKLFRKDDWILAIRELNMHTFLLNNVPFLEDMYEF